VQLVEKVALPMILNAYFRTVEDWLQAIPPEYLSKSPRVNMAFAWMHLMRRNFTEAAPHLERLQEIFATPKVEKIEPALWGIVALIYVLNTQDGRWRNMTQNRR
jgi:ATP/maltotriose-dependent transcriptional regulator MalT